MGEKRFGQTMIQVHNCNIVAERVEAIVNAANCQLQLGGGIAGAILQHGGIEVEDECLALEKKFGSIETGSAIPTNSGNLKQNGIKYVIHAVGPRWNGGNANEKALLSSCIARLLDWTITLGIRSIAIPAISSGIFGFPKKRNAEIIVATIIRFLTDSPSRLEKIYLTNLDHEACSQMRKALDTIDESNFMSYLDPGEAVKVRHERDYSHLNTFPNVSRGKRNDDGSDSSSSSDLSPSEDEEAEVTIEKEVDGFTIERVKRNDRAIQENRPKKESGVTMKIGHDRRETRQDRGRNTCLIGSFAKHMESSTEDSQKLQKMMSQMLKPVNTSIDPVDS